MERNRLALLNVALLVVGLTACLPTAAPPPSPGAATMAPPAGSVMALPTVVVEAPPAATATAMRETEMTEIYAAADWYRSRREPEDMWQGRLQKRTAPVGPAGRGGLSYTLVTQDEQLPVYAANMEGKLAPLVGYDVVVRGKLVDLRDEGFGQELWIASIRAVGTEQR